MAKRGRPPKIDGWRYTDADAVKTIKALQAKVAKLTEERDEYRQMWEGKLLTNQELALEIIEAEDRIKELLAEIRMYEHETSTLRHIIIDALRGYDR